MERLHKALFESEKDTVGMHQYKTIYNEYFSQETFTRFLYRLVCIHYLKRSIC